MAIEYDFLTYRVKKWQRRQESFFPHDISLAVKGKGVHELGKREMGRKHFFMAMIMLVRAFQ